MINIVAHRGAWSEEKDQNSVLAFSRALEFGFSVEIDVRDHDNALILAHDPVSKESAAPVFKSISMSFELHQEQRIFVDVKSAELQQLFKSLPPTLLSRCLFFDAAIPDLTKFKKAELNYLIRHSEYELDIESDLYVSAAGVCIDQFSNFKSPPNHVINKLKDDKKLLFFISEDLHKRDYQPQWNWLKSQFASHPKQSIYLCTDRLKDAKEFFF